MSQLSGRTIFIAVGILAAIMFVFRTNKKEGFRKVDSKKSCPDLLVQKGTKIYLYNTNRAEVPGVNPITFNNLEEYTEFLDWQKSDLAQVSRKVGFHPQVPLVMQREHCLMNRLI